MLCTCTENSVNLQHVLKQNEKKETDNTISISRGIIHFLRIHLQRDGHIVNISCYLFYAMMGKSPHIQECGVINFFADSVTKATWEVDSNLSTVPLGWCLNVNKIWGRAKFPFKRSKLN